MRTGTKFASELELRTYHGQHERKRRCRQLFRAETACDEDRNGLDRIL